MANVQLSADNIMGAQADEDAPVNLDMDALLYKQKMIKVRTLVEIAKATIGDYTPSDVEMHDVMDGEFRRLLEDIHTRYVLAQAEICNLLTHLKDSDVDRQRTEKLYSLQKSLQTKWKENAIGVRRKAFNLKEAAATRRQRIVKSQSRPIRIDEDTPDEPMTGNDDEESDTDTESDIQSPERNDKRVSENEDSGSSSDVVYKNTRKSQLLLKAPYKRRLNGKRMGKAQKNLQGNSRMKTRSMILALVPRRRNAKE